MTPGGVIGNVGSGRDDTELDASGDTKLDFLGMVALGAEVIDPASGGEAGLPPTMEISID
jgi:hypothetical protein